jgi:hypothetical protein
MVLLWAGGSGLVGKSGRRMVGGRKRLVRWSLIVEVRHRWVHVGMLKVGGNCGCHSGRMVVRGRDGMRLYGGFSQVIVGGVGRGCGVRGVVEFRRER